MRCAEAAGNTLKFPGEQVVTGFGRCERVNGFVNETLRNKGDRIDTARHGRRLIAADLRISDVGKKARPQLTGS